MIREKLESTLEVSRETMKVNIASVSEICSKCGDAYIRGTNNGYCRKCHAAYMRKNRRRHSELNPESKKKANARSYANVYLNRGKIQKQPCSKCGDDNSQMHHEDYDKPLDIIWLCRKCHLDLHINEEKT